MELCYELFNKIKNEIEKEKNITKLLTCANNYCKENNIYLIFPICIYKNNIICNYINTEEIIKKNDIVKIEFGINYNNEHFYLCETIIDQNNENSKHKQIIKVLDKIEKKIKLMFKEGITSDEIRIAIESYCTKYDVFPIENCISFENYNSTSEYEPKYIILNWKNNEEYPNTCFELLKNEIYTMNITLISTSTSDFKIKEKTPALIYRLNDTKINLKLKSSKEFYNKIKNEHNFDAFYLNTNNIDAKSKLGMKECLEKELLIKYPINYLCNKEPVFTKKFTIRVK